MDQLGLWDMAHSVHVLKGQLPRLRTELTVASQAVRLLAGGGLSPAAASNPTEVTRAAARQKGDVSELRAVVAVLRKKIRKRLGD